MIKLPYSFNKCIVPYSIEIIEPILVYICKLSSNDQSSLFRLPFCNRAQIFKVSTFVVNKCIAAPYSGLIRVVSFRFFLKPMSFLQPSDDEASARGDVLFVAALGIHQRRGCMSLDVCYGPLLLTYIRYAANRLSVTVCHTVHSAQACFDARIYSLLLLLFSVRRRRKWKNM